jgi:hypothetical protein
MAKMEWAQKAAFFEAKVPKETIDVEGLGRVNVWGLTAGEKDDYENRVMSFSGRSRELKMSNARAILLQLTVRDQHGNRMFGAKDLAKLGTIPVLLVEQILAVAKRLSGMDEGELDELVKNSQAAQDLDVTD